MKKAHAFDRTADTMADQFFMTRIRRPADPETPAESKSPVRAAESESSSADGTERVRDQESEIADIRTPTQPSGYTPRGSYVDVRAKNSPFALILGDRLQQETERLESRHLVNPLQTTAPAAAALSKSAHHQCVHAQLNELPDRLQTPLGRAQLHQHFQPD
jgi:hypothetical protein